MSREAELPRERWLVLAVAATVALMLVPTLGGYFLSDDFSYVYGISSAFENRALIADVARQFMNGVTTAGNHYYRPLTYASFALDYRLHGADPFGYRVVNVVLHSANAAMVGSLFLALSRQTQVAPSLTAAAVAGLIFGLFPSSLEVVAWISGRFDALATFFLLLTLIFFVRPDRWRHGAPICLALALMAKESGILAIVFAGLIAVADKAGLSTRPSWVDRFSGVVRRLAPLLLVTIAYFFLRWQIFGTPFKVYAHAKPLANLVAGTWLETLASWPAWFMRSTGGSPAARLFLFCMAAAAVVLCIGIWRDKPLRRLAALYATALLVAFAVSFASTPDFAVDGRNGRLFYEILLPGSWLLALPVVLVSQSNAAALTASNRRASIAKLYALAVVACLGWLFIPAAAAWRDVGLQSRALRDTLAATAERLDGDEYGVVFTSDWNGNIPFTLNAQGGFVLPPFQSRPVITKVVMQTQNDFDLFTRATEAGMVTRLKKGEREAILEQERFAGRETRAEWPTQYWCWRGEGRALHEMQVAPEVASRERHVAALKEAYAKCVAG